MQAIEGSEGFLVDICLHMDVTKDVAVKRALVQLACGTSQVGGQTPVGSVAGGSPLTGSLGG